MISSDSDEPDHDDGHDVNDKTKMQQSQFSQKLDLDLVMAKVEAVTEDVTEAEDVTEN